MSFIFNLTSQLSKFRALHSAVLNLGCSKNDHIIFRPVRRMVSLFKGQEDRFNGVTIDSTDERCTEEEFPGKLKASLEHWTEKKKRGIWFKVHVRQSDWIPVLVKNGFNYHHANDGYVMLYNWLPEEKDNIPTYAHTMLAVGAIVINHKNELLVVKEKHFLTSHWKFPGGLVEPGENFIDAAIREVKEETNIDCEFESLISLRHAHGTQFGCSDLYLVISMKALNTDIKKCPREITHCEWFDVDKFLKSDEVSEFNKLMAQRYVEYKENNIKIECRDGYHALLKKHYQTYSVIKDVPREEK